MKRDEWLKDFSDHTAEIVLHLWVLAATVVSIWLIHLLLNYLLGRHATFFGVLPMSWVMDIAHLLALGRFIWKIARGFQED